MGIQLKWDDSGRVPEKTVIYWAFGESWTWTDFAQCVEEAYDWQMQSVPKTIHTIADMQEGKGMFAADAISSITYSIKHVPPNRGKVVVVGASRLLKLLEPIIRRLVPQLSAAYVLVDSLDEAYELVLAELDRQETNPENGNST